MVVEPATSNQRRALVLSQYQARPLVEARRAGHVETTSSPDLGLTRVEVELTDSGVVFALASEPARHHPQTHGVPRGDSGRAAAGETELVPWAVVEEIAASEGACFIASEGAVVRKIQAFSSEFNRAYSLRATPRAPTVMVSGVLMHRIKGTTPDVDTQTKMATLGPITGRVLDTATGLGYTAIEAVRRGARSVVSIELDPTMSQIARDNPWSQALFSDDRIERLFGDAFDVIRELPDQSFSRIVHDPPVFGLAGQLYSAEFYVQLVRVMQRGGRLFHYIGDLESRSGRRVSEGAMRRLREVGFRRVSRRSEAFGLIAIL